MKSILLLVLLSLFGCAMPLNRNENSIMDDAQILQERECDCWMWGSPRQDRPYVMKWYEARITEGCEEYKYCGVCEKCGRYGHNTVDPLDKSKTITFCDQHYLEYLRTP
jgi:hypothetical protein